MGLIEKLDAPTRAINSLLCKLQSPFLLYLRLYVAWVFLKSGMHKIGDWETTLMLFEYEYAVPALPFELAAYLATISELVLPIFLIAGFGTRFFAIALTFVNIMAVVSYYATLAKGATVGQGICKRAIDAGLSTSLAEGLTIELDAFVEVFRTEDSQIGVKSFLENGPGKAEFTGR